MHPSDQWMRKNIGTGVATISRQSITLSATHPAASSRNECELICSYNWVKNRPLTVYVPGMFGRRVTTLETKRLNRCSKTPELTRASFAGGAPVYNREQLKFPLKVNQSKILVSNLQTASTIFEVIFKATEIMNPEFKFDAIDVITNRNSLLKFFDFFQGRSLESFRVDLSMVGNTLIVERCDKSATEWIRQLQNNSARGSGHAFEQAITKMPDELIDSECHHRVLRYNLAGLECAVRFEVDACVEDAVLDTSKKDQVRHKEAPEQSSVKGQALNEILDGPGRKEDSQGNSVFAHPHGQGTAQARTGEIKSSTVTFKPLKNCLPQMWFGRTPWLIRGRHDQGIYSTILVENFSEELLEWEKKNQVAMQKTSALLSQLRDIVRGSANKSCALIYKRGDPEQLHVFVSTAGRKPLPDVVVEQFWDNIS